MQQHRSHPVRTQARSRRGLSVPEAILIALLVALLIAAALSPAWRGRDASETRSTSVTVGEHDTLWEIATAHPAPDTSVAGTVDLIMSMNGLASGTIHPGQTLRVPTAVEADTALAQR